MKSVPKKARLPPGTLVYVGEKKLEGPDTSWIEHDQRSAQGEQWRESH